MNLTINGETRVSQSETLSALVEELGMRPDRVAIELNREIVSRDRWSQTRLKDGDQLEIVHFVGGGSAKRHSGWSLTRLATDLAPRFFSKHVSKFPPHGSPMSYLPASRV